MSGSDVDEEAVIYTQARLTPAMTWVSAKSRNPLRRRTTIDIHMSYDTKHHTADSQLRLDCLCARCCGIVFDNRRR